MENEARPLLQAMSAVGNLFNANEKPADGGNSSAQPYGLDPNMQSNKPSNVASPEHDLKKVVALISSGAAAGAVIGGAVGKTSKCVLVGAVLGGVAGLIYDRISHVKEKKPAQAVQFSGPVERLERGSGSE